MIDELREEAIVNKVGGRFKLSTLIQKRLVALNAGHRPLVDVNTNERLQIVIQEILQDKIYLDTESNVRIRATPADVGGPPELDLSNLERHRRATSPMMQGREIVIAVTGGIAAYKTAMLVSQLVQAGAHVSVALTPAAERFVGRATFAALTGRPVATEVFDERQYPLGAHIELAERAELLCVAPATAHFLAQAASGLASDLVATLFLACRPPVLVAPAMNTRMWQHPAVQRNVERLRADGVVLVDPEDGWLSCRQQGTGRMASPERLRDAIAAQLANLPRGG